MESSRLDLLNDMAERRPILKNNQNMYHPRFGFTPKTGVTFPKTRLLFLLCAILFTMDQLYKQRSAWGRKMEEGR